MPSPEELARERRPCHALEAEVFASEIRLRGESGQPLGLTKWALFAWHAIYDLARRAKSVDRTNSVLEM
jgi:hypothetical protein